MANVWIEIGIAGGAMLATSFLFNFIQRALAPSVEKEYTQQGTIFRSYGDARMTYMLFHPFVSSAVLHALRSLIPMTRLSNDQVALVAWAVGPLPGVLIDYSCFRISLKLAISWWCISALQLLTGARMMTFRRTFG